MQEPAADPVQVIVFNDGDRSVGMMVDQILDVAEEAVTVRQKTSRKGLLGSGVVGKRVADFLDLNYVIHTGGRRIGSMARRESRLSRRILVAEGSAFSRGLIRSGLDMAGYRVFEAANLDEAIRGLEQQPVDVVVTALDLPPQWQFRAARSHATAAGVEADPGTDAGRIGRAGRRHKRGESIDFEDCQVKFDREAMLESMARLASALAARRNCAGMRR